MKSVALEQFWKCQVLAAQAVDDERAYANDQDRFDVGAFGHPDFIDRCKAG